jgi:methylated-DNA-[protein]-cysteine S-methyltransferase
VAWEYTTTGRSRNPLTDDVPVCRRFYIERFDSPTGRIVVITDEEQQLRVVDWEDCEKRMRHLMRRQYGEGGISPCENPRTSRARRALDAYFDGDFAAIDSLPTAARGTAFQSQVWSALRTVPFGQTINYARLAGRIGHPTAARAVGLANGANPIAIVVPCHRVIGADGALTGYGGGLARKRWLLAHERVNVPSRS